MKPSGMRDGARESRTVPELFRDGWDRWKFPHAATKVYSCMLDAPLANALLRMLNWPKMALFTCLPPRSTRGTKRKRSLGYSPHLRRLWRRLVKETYSSNGDSRFTEAEEYGV